MPRRATLPREWTAQAWGLRGRFDLPGERFISFAHAGSHTADQHLLGWAGWDRGDRVLALADLVAEHASDPDHDRESDVLIQLLAGLHEVLTTARQGTNGPREEAAEERSIQWKHLLGDWLDRLGLTEADLTGWRPPEPRRGRPRKVVR
jgi:hypothetical protein